MNSRRQKVTSVIALFLAVALSQVYVHATLPGSSGSTNGSSSASVPSGRLTANYSSPAMNSLVKVNDINVESGATVFPGSRISTPEGVGATVELGALGRIDIAQSSSLTLKFTAESVEVNLDSGYTALTTNKGVNGTLMTSDGSVKHTDTTKRSSVTGGNAAAQGGGTAGGGGGGAGVGASETFGLIVFTSAVAISLIFIPCRGGRPGTVSPFSAGEDCHHHP